MICAKCKKEIKVNEVYRHMNGVGEVHHQCPQDPQQKSLMADDDELPIDHVPESYPD